MAKKESSKNVLIVGGADGIGTWLAKRVFGKSPEIGRITLSDVKPIIGSSDSEPTNPDPKHLPEFKSLKVQVDAVRFRGTSEPEWTPVNTSITSPSQALTLRDYDLVILAVPEDKFEQAAAEILPHLSTNAAIIDVTSSKRLSIPAMLKHAPKGVSVLGTHPLFGPAVPDTIGQTFVFVPTERTDPDQQQWLDTLLRSFGAIIEKTDAETHDKYMLFVQTLAHYTYLVFGKTLNRASDIGFDFNESLRFSTPPYSILTAFMARIIGGNPELYAQIQAEPKSDNIRRLLAESAQELAEQFTQGNDETLAAIHEIIEPFKASEVARGYANSIVLVDSVQQSYRDLHHRRESGELTIVEVRDPLEQRGTSRIHVGIVENIDGQSVIISERTTTVDEKWYIAYDQESEQALRKSGKGVKQRSTRIERRNIRRVFTPAETRDWRVETLEHHVRDVAVLSEDTVDIEHICNVLAQITDSVVYGNVHEPNDATWLSRYGMRNKVLRFTIFGDRNPNVTVAQIADSLRLFGIRTQN